MLHISSLPGKFGIGTFGQEAYRFVDFLKETNQTYWQLLPLTSTSYGDSPYQSFSAVAGNVNFIDFDLLREKGLLQEADYATVSFGDDEEAVDYALLFKVRRPILEKAVANFLTAEKNREKLKVFEEQNETWLDDYAEFMAIKEHFGHKALQEWGDKKAIQRDEERLVHYRRLLADEINIITRLLSISFLNNGWRLKHMPIRSTSKLLAICLSMLLRTALKSGPCLNSLKWMKI